MPSAIRLVPMVKRPMMITGASTAQGWDEQRQPVLVDHLAPVGGAGVGGEAQEAEPATRPIE